MNKCIKNPTFILQDSSINTSPVDGRNKKDTSSTGVRTAFHNNQDMEEEILIGKDVKNALSETSSGVSSYRCVMVGLQKVFNSNFQICPLDSLQLLFHE